MVPAARARPITAPNRPRPRQNFSPPLPPPPSPPSPPLPASASASASTLAAARPSSPLSPSPPLPLLPRERPCAPAWPHCTGCLCHLSKASARPLWPPRTGPLPPSLLSSLPLFKPKPARESARHKGCETDADHRLRCSTVGRLACVSLCFVVVVRPWSGVPLAGNYRCGALTRPKAPDLRSREAWKLWPASLWRSPRCPAGPRQPSAVRICAKPREDGPNEDAGPRPAKLGLPRYRHYPSAGQG